MQLFLLFNIKQVKPCIGSFTHAQLLSRRAGESQLGQIPVPSISQLFLSESKRLCTVGMQLKILLICQLFHII